MATVPLQRVKVAVPLNIGGTGRPQVYMQAPCGCLFRPPLGGDHDAVWHPCATHYRGMPTKAAPGLLAALQDIANYLEAEPTQTLVPDGRIRDAKAAIAEAEKEE